MENFIPYGYEPFNPQTAIGRYRQSFYKACRKFLSFASAYQALEEQIAEDATLYATAPFRYGVGRNRSLSIELKASLAVKAYIRHQFTDYEHELSRLMPSWNDPIYWYIKGNSQRKVVDFLAKHRADADPVECLS